MGPPTPIFPSKNDITFSDVQVTFRRHISRRIPEKWYCICICMNALSSSCIYFWSFLCYFVRTFILHVHILSSLFHLCSALLHCTALLCTTARWQSHSNLSTTSPKVQTVSRRAWSASHAFTARVLGVSAVTAARKTVDSMPEILAAAVQEEVTPSVLLLYYPVMMKFYFRHTVGVLILCLCSYSV